MARVEIVLTQEVKNKLIEIAKADNRTMTSMIIQLIEDRYRSLNK